MSGEHDQDSPSDPHGEGDEAAGTPPPRLRLRSLKVHAFRDVRPGTELTFGDGFHLILGKNGTGKSTLVELLAAVSALGFRRPFFSETPFHVEASFVVGEIALHAKIRRTFETDVVLPLGGPTTHEAAEVVIRVEHRDPPLCYWIQARTGKGLGVFTKDPGNGPATPVHELAWADDPLDLSLALPLLSAAFVKNADQSALDDHPAIPTAIARVFDSPGTAAPFDEALGTLRAMVGGGLAVLLSPKVQSHPWLPPPLHFEGKGEPISLPLSNHPLLKSMLEQLGFNDAIAYFGPGASTDSGWRYSSPSFQFFRGGKPVRRHDQLSFGQQRLFSFAWYLACNPDVAIADELVNGLHSDWIDWCVDVLRDRQSFLTSQNPILVDTVPFESEEEIKRGIILCESVHDAEHDTNELRWRQLDERESELISRALQQSRLDLLSDLLHALDLW